MTLLLADEMVMIFFQAAFATLGVLSSIYILTQKIDGKRVFAVLFFSVALLSSLKLLEATEILSLSSSKRLFLSTLLLFSGGLNVLFYTQKENKAGLFYKGILIAGAVMLCAGVSPERYLLFAFLPVYYFFFTLTAVRSGLCKKRIEQSGKVYLSMLFVLGLLLPLGYWAGPGGAGFLQGRFSLIAEFGLLLLLYSLIFLKNNISTKQFLKYFLSLIFTYFICVFFAYFSSSFYAFVTQRTHQKREIFLAITHLSFFVVVLLHLFYGSFCRWLVKFFIRSFEEKEEALRELTLEINPLYKIKDIFLSFADNFERLAGFRLKASLILQDEKKAVVIADRKERDITGDLHIFRNAVSGEIVVPSEFFFRSTFLILNSLKKFDIVQDFGYIIPVKVKGTFEGFFITEPLTLNQKRKTARLLSFLEHFKETVEKVMLNAKQLGREKEIQDKILALQEKKRTSDEFKRKNTELQTALEQLQNKQKQLIMAEKWASICQVTVSLNHEINNPLTHIMGSSQILKMQINKGSSLSKDEMYDYLCKVEVQCQRIKDIIENLRKVSEPVTVNYLSDVKMLNLKK